MVGLKGFDLTNPRVRTLYRNPERDNRIIMANRQAFLLAIRNSVDRAKSEGQK
jgi:hypothetical protein